MHFHEHFRTSRVVREISRPDRRNTLFAVEVGGESEQEAAIGVKKFGEKYCSVALVTS